MQKCGNYRDTDVSKITNFLFADIFPPISRVFSSTNREEPHKMINRKVPHRTINRKVPNRIIKRKVPPIIINKKVLHIIINRKVPHTIIIGRCHT